MVPPRVRVVLINACHQLRGTEGESESFRPTLSRASDVETKLCALKQLPLEQRSAVPSSTKQLGREVPPANCSNRSTVVATADSSSLRRRDNGVKQDEGREMIGEMSRIDSHGTFPTESYVSWKGSLIQVHDGVSLVRVA